MTFDVNITRRAESDIDDLSKRFGPGGAAWFAKLQVALAALDTHPTRFALADEADDLGLELRELLFGKRRGTYRVLFTIDSSTVNIRHIRPASRGPVRLADLG